MKPGNLTIHCYPESALLPGTIGKNSQSLTLVGVYPCFGFVDDNARCLRGGVCPEIAYPEALGGGL